MKKIHGEMLEHLVKLGILDITNRYDVKRSDVVRTFVELYERNRNRHPFNYVQFEQLYVSQVYHCLNTTNKYYKMKEYQNEKI